MEDCVTKTVQTNKKYSSRLTGNQFLYNEFKVACDLLSQGISKQEAAQKIVNENLFEYRSLKAVGKHIGTVWERASYLDEYLLKELFKQPNEIGRLINFYAILKYDLLFLEFMEDVISEKVHTYQLELSRADISIFFGVKAEESEIVAGFKESTLKRLNLAYVEILQGAGYLTKSNNKLELNIPTIIYQITNHLEDIGEKRYAKAMLGV